MKITKLLWLIVSLLIIFQSCVKDELDFDKLSDRVKFNPNLYTPLLKGSLTCNDLFENKFEDSTLLIKDGMIYLYLNQDSMFILNTADFFNIPDQEAKHYVLNSGPIDIFYPVSAVYELTRAETFDMNFNNDMRADSIYFNPGILRLSITSNFASSGRLNIRIPGLSINEKIFDTTYYFNRATGDYQHIDDIPLEDAKIILDNSIPGVRRVNAIFTITQNMNAGETIEANSETSIDMSFHDLNSFEAIFGYVGDTSHYFDTISTIDFGPLTGISGTFAATNPKMSLNYTNSFGFPIGLDFKIKGYYNNNDSVILAPADEIIEYSSDFRNPVVTDQIIYNRENISNIDELFVFPPPEGIGFTGTGNINPAGYTDNNYVLDDSKFILGMDIEIPLEFRANLTLRDTLNIKFDDLDDFNYLEYARLHYVIRNEFPINFDASIVLYDSITDTHIDTIQVSGGGDFIKAAPVDANGVTIITQVEEVRSSTLLTKDETRNLINSSKAILIAKISTYEPLTVPSVKILDNYNFDFHTYLECEILYEDEP